MLITYVERFETIFGLLKCLVNISVLVHGNFRRNLTTGGILSYDNVPEGLKKQLLVKTKVEEDPEVLQARQTLTRTKTPNQLGQIHGLDDFPLPQKLDTLMRPSKRNLKSTKDKQEEKKRR